MKRKPKARAKVRMPKDAEERFEKAAYDDLCTFTTGRKVDAALKWSKKIGEPIKPRKK